MHPNRDPKRQQRSLKNLSNLYQAILQKDISKAKLIIDIEVKDAKLVNGLLKIDLEHIVPEHKKPKTIKVK